eukprot:scaffold189703_cov15-Tisochrysis_lutea.AAC.1
MSICIEKQVWILAPSFFQDTNEPQYALSRLLKGDKGSLFVVGDPDQAVYSGPPKCKVMSIRRQAV